MDDIRKWLKGNKDYEAGAKLYLIHGNDHALRRVFSEPISAFKKLKLEEALRELLHGKTTVQKKIVVSKAAAIEHIARSNKKWPKEKDVTLTAMHLKWKPLFAELMFLSNRLYQVAAAGLIDAAAKNKAGEMAHRILDLDDECDAIYEQRDYYLKYKKLPEAQKPMELVVDTLKIPLALNNARRYVRDYKQKLKKNPEDVFAAERLRQYEWAVEEYKKILKLD